MLASSKGNPMRIFALGRIAKLAALLLLACLPAQSAWPQQAIKIDGSTGTAPLVSALAKAYAQKQPGVAIEIGKGLGTKERIEALAAGAIEIAIASHGLDPAELQRRGLAAHEIARTPVVFGVNAGVAMRSLSEPQLCAIYAGERTNWKEFGGPDLAIAARTRPDSEVDAEVVRIGIGCLRRLKLPEAVKVMPRGGDMARELAAAPGAIGMTTATVVEQSAGKIRALALEGVEPSEANVLSGRYRLTRPAFLVTKGAPSAAVADFLRFVSGPEGAAVIKANGAIAVLGR